MQAQVDSGVAVAVGSSAAFFSMVFGMDMQSVMAVALMAFVGTCFAIGFTNSMTYRRALLWSIGGVVATLVLLPVLLSIGMRLEPDLITTVPKPPMASIFAFCLVFFREKILNKIGIQIDEVGK